MIHSRTAMTSRTAMSAPFAWRRLPYLPAIVGQEGKMFGPFHGWYGTASAALLAAATAGGAAAAEQSFSLAITGATGTRYSGECTLTTAAGDKTIELSGMVPRHDELTAEAIVCRIESAGLITVEIAHDGSRSRSTINHGTAHIAVR